MTSFVPCSSNKQSETTVLLLYILTASLEDEDLYYKNLVPFTKMAWDGGKRDADGIPVS